MQEELDPGVRIVLDQHAVNPQPAVTTDDQALLRALRQAAAYDASSKLGKAANGLPAAEFDVRGGARSGIIDWNDRFHGGWGANPSPFASASRSTTPNFSDFLAKVVGSNGAGEDGEGAKFDKLAGALNAGKVSKAGKTAGR